MSSIILKVEIRGGTFLPKACEDAIELAGKLGVTVRFDFNGIGLWAKGDSSITKIQNDYEKMCDEGTHK